MDKYEEFIKKARYFPALMLTKGTETEYIRWKEEETKKVVDHYAEKISKLKPGAEVRYIKRDWESDIFGKAGSGTLSKKAKIRRKHAYEHEGDMATRNGRIKLRKTGPSFELENTDQRYLPYEFVL